MRNVKHYFLKYTHRILKRVPILFPLLFHVYRYFQPRVTMGAVGVLFNEDGKVLLVEHVFHPKTPWGLPGGWVAKNEDPSETVRRELLEELSLEVEVGAIIMVDMPWKNHVDLAYMCRTNNTIGDLSYELMSFRWFAISELPKLLSFHQAAIQRVLQMRENSDYELWLQH